jgi:hypothetical protein
MSKEEFLPNDIPDDSDTESEASDEEPVQSGKVVLKYRERFDADKLAHIIKHKEKYVKEMRQRCLDKGDSFHLPERYLKKSREGVCETVYRQV